MPKLFKAVFFDVDNTLLDFRKSADKTTEMIFKKKGLPFFPDVTTSMFHEVNAELWGQIENGTLTEEGLHEVRWGIVLERLGISGVDGKEIEHDFFYGLRENVVKIDGADELVSSLYRKYKLYIISNANHAQQLIRLENAGLLKYMDDVFTAENIGVAKPDKAFFDGCFGRVPELKKEDVLLVGDSISADIEGGKNYGLKTVWYCSDKGKAKKNEISDYVVTSLLEIREILN